MKTRDEFRRSADGVDAELWIAGVRKLPARLDFHPDQTLVGDDYLEIGGLGRNDKAFAVDHAAADQIVASQHVTAFLVDGRAYDDVSAGPLSRSRRCGE